MTARARDPEPAPEVSDESGEEGLDLETIKDAIGFVVRSSLRRPLLAGAVFVLVGGLGLGLAQTMPRTYNAQVKLLAQRNVVLPALGNPTSAVSRENDNPAHNVADVIMQRDNLIALVKQANLVERFYGNRSAVFRLKDRIYELVNGPLSDEDKLRNMVGTLWKRLQVWSDDATGAVSINVDWSDPHMAYELATLVQRNFIEARYDSETRMIQDAISVLEDHAKTELQQVDTALADYQAAQAERARAAPQVAGPAAASRPGMQQAPVFAAPAAPTPAAAPPDPDLTKALEEKRRRIRVLEEERARDIDGLKQQLSQAELTLTPMHPQVVGMRQRLDRLRAPSPELDQLKSEERSLMAQIAPSASPAAAPGGPSPQQVYRPSMPLPVAPPTSTGPKSAAETERQERDPALAPLRGRLDAAIHRYQDVMALIDGARLDLDIARTAFQYRYSVITPAELPRNPKKPIATLVALASIPLAIIVALLSSATADFWSGRVVEPWQVRRRLKLAILGELEPPA